MFVSRVTSSDAPANQQPEKKTRWRCRVFDCCRVSFTASHQSHSHQSGLVKDSKVCLCVTELWESLFPPTEKSTSRSGCRRPGRRRRAENPSETSEEVTRLFSHHWQCLSGRKKVKQKQSLLQNYSLSLPPCCSPVKATDGTLTADEVDEVVEFDALTEEEEEAVTKTEKKAANRKHELHRLTSFLLSGYRTLTNQDSSSNRSLSHVHSSHSKAQKYQKLPSDVWSDLLTYSLIR